MDGLIDIGNGHNCTFLFSSDLVLAKCSQSVMLIFHHVMALFIKTLHSCVLSGPATEQNKKKPAHSHLAAVFPLCAEAQSEIQAISAFSRCGMKAENIIGREPVGCSG